MSARLVFPATALLSLALLGACSSGAGRPATQPATTPVVVQKQADTQQQQAKLVATNVADLGQVLTDQNGMTLYLFTKDSKKPSKSTCDGKCAQTWPPLLAEGDVQVTGADPKLLGKVKRADGTEQVTYGGWPMYRYAKDTAPGQANGHAVGGTWFEVEPAGCKVAEGKKPTQPSGSLSGTAANAAPGSSSY